MIGLGKTHFTPLSLNICFLTHRSPYKGGSIVQLKVLFSFLQRMYVFILQKVQPLLLLYPNCAMRPELLVVAYFDDGFVVGGCLLRQSWNICKHLLAFWSVWIATVGALLQLAARRVKRALLHLTNGPQEYVIYKETEASDLMRVWMYTVCNVFGKWHSNDNSCLGVWFFFFRSTKNVCAESFWPRQKFTGAHDKITGACDK